MFMAPGSVHEKIISWVGSNRTVLDVGCASGYLGAEIKKMNNKVFGIEISAKAAEEAKMALDSVLVGNIEEIDLPYAEKQFDVIICADVLEHLFNPSVVLEKLRKYLKDDGFMIISVPNIAHWSIRLELLFGRFDYQKSGILDDGHIRFYTAKNIRKAIHAAGFDVVSDESVLSLPKGFNRLFNYIGLSKLIRFVFPNLFIAQFLFLAQKSKRAI